jgi:hypothetical protein
MWMKKQILALLTENCVWTRLNINCFTSLGLLFTWLRCLWDYVTSESRTSEYWTGKDVEGSCHGLIRGGIEENRGKLVRILISQKTFKLNASQFHVRNIVAWNKSLGDQRTHKFYLLGTKCELWLKRCCLCKYTTFYVI